MDPLSPRVLTTVQGLSRALGYVPSFKEEIAVLECEQ